jgi:uncharacterized protein (TIGR02145 family)
MKLIKTIALFLIISISFNSFVFADSGNKGHNEKDDPLVNLINPESGHPGQTLTVTISGQNTHFTQGTNMVWFEQGTSTIQAYNIYSVNDTILDATFSLPFSPLGYYDVNCYNSYDGLLQPLENGFLLEFPIINSINPESGYNGQTLTVTISGQNTHFTQGTNMIWFNQGSSTIQAYNVNSVNDTILDATFNLPYSPLGYYDVNGSNYYDGTFLPLENGFLLIGIQNYDLVSGFQFVSSRLIPENPDMLVVVEEILNENLVFIRNSQGQTLRKIGPNWVNGIGDWDIDEGYLVKMNADDSFSIEGDAIDPATPIPLTTGFKFVSYFPETPIDALDAFETIIGDNLEFIRNSQGQTLRKIGPNWVNGLGDCQPGEGYLVKMYADDILIYPTSFTCGDPFTDPRDEQIYSTVQIGDQCWMAENLNIGEMINGFEEMTNNSVIEKYCYDNNTANCDEYGGLYQWNEMMQYTTTPGVQGICPADWHIPTDDEWKILEGTVDSQYPVGDPIWNNTGYRGYDAGLNLKSITGWNSGGNGSGLYDFGALPAGFRYPSGDFYTLGYYGYFWSSSQDYTRTAWYRLLDYDYDVVHRITYSKDYGFSVRCLKDYSKIHTDVQNPFDNLSIQDKNHAYELSDQKTKSNETIHFVFKGGNPAEAVYTIYIEGLEIGDEVAAYDGNKMIGSLKINSQNAFENELPVFSTLINGEGYEKGNPIILKVWSENNIIPADFTMEPIYDSYVSEVYPNEDGEYSIVNITKGSIENAEETISIYPNPSKGIFNISLKGIKGNISIKVFDLRGKEYSNFELSGYISTQLDLRELPAGVYFISFSGEDFSEVRKIVIQ